MPSAEHIRNVLERYVALVTAGDADAVAALYAEDATVEDPIGTPLHRGRDAIRKFYAASAGAARLELSGPVRVAGREAAAPLVATVGQGERRSYIDIIDVMAFDDEGLITSMRAFWSPEAIRSGGERADAQ